MDLERKARNGNRLKVGLPPLENGFNPLIRIHGTEAAANLEQLPSWNAPDNSLILQTFEWHVPADRQHWRRLQNRLPEYKAIGVDQIWVPPGCKGMDANGNGYDIYDLYDLGEFDQKGAVPTKWGTKRELEDLMCQAQNLGIGVIWDAVLNHKAGADYPEPFQAVKVDPKRKIYISLTFVDIRLIVNFRSFTNR